MRFLLVWVLVLVVFFLSEFEAIILPVKEGGKLYAVAQTGSKFSSI